MSDHSISIVPKKSSYPGNKEKAAEILAWLAGRDIVKLTPSDCILGSENGYAISGGAKKVTNEPNLLPFSLVTNGLQIITERNIFHTGENGFEKIICPNCKEDISQDDLSFMDEWQEQGTDEVHCPLCNAPADIHAFSFSPEWGFSDLGFTFWNWPDLTDDFINQFRQKLGSDINMVFTWI